jgi:hypothetical protein
MRRKSGCGVGVAAGIQGWHWEAAQLRGDWLPGSREQNDGDLLVRDFWKP